MRLDRQIRINDLLLQREELFLRIHAAETEIVRLLRGPYPFTRPTLPSDRKGKKKPAAARPLTIVPPAPAEAALRRLADEEHAYRVTYLQFGRKTIEIHPDFSALATLLAAQASHLRVLKIETLDAGGQTVAVLGESVADNDPPRPSTPS